MIRFLASEDIPQLYQLLKNHELLRLNDYDVRKAVLSSCGVAQVCGKIKLDDPLNRFVVVLCDKLMPDHDADLRKISKPDLLVFLENFVQIYKNQLQLEEIRFIGKVIDKWEIYQKSEIRTHQQELVKKTETQFRQQTVIPPQSCETRHLPHLLHQKIIGFLKSIPNIEEHSTQKALIADAALDANLHFQIDFRCPPLHFFPSLISTLNQYGELEDGRDALEAVLETAKGYVGKKQQNNCCLLLKELRAISVQKHSYISQKTVKTEQISKQHLQSNEEPSRELIDSQIISEFDLEKLSKQLRKHLQEYKGAFAFTIGGKRIGESNIREYIITRILQESSPKIKTYKRFEIKLHRGNISEPDYMIEQAITREYQYGSFFDLFKQTSEDIVLIVWNHDIPVRTMTPIAEMFWEKTCLQSTPFLDNERRHFLVIWVNVNNRVVAE